MPHACRCCYVSYELRFHEYFGDSWSPWSICESQTHTTSAKGKCMKMHENSWKYMKMKCNIFSVFYILYVFSERFPPFSRIFAPFFAVLTYFQIVFHRFYVFLNRFSSVKHNFEPFLMVFTYFWSNFHDFNVFLQGFSRFSYIFESFSIFFDRHGKSWPSISFDRHGKSWPSIFFDRHGKSWLFFFCHCMQ